MVQKFDANFPAFLAQKLEDKWLIKLDANKSTSGVKTAKNLQSGIERRDDGSIARNI